MKAWEKGSKQKLYTKIGGWDKWFENYNNEETCMLDDASIPTQQDKAESYSRIKNLISDGACPVEWKGGSTQFTSRAFIIVSNTSPHMFAETAPQDDKQALMNRIGDRGQSFHCKTKKQVREGVLQDWMHQWLTMCHGNICPYDQYMKDAMIFKADPDFASMVPMDDVMISVEGSKARRKRYRDMATERVMESEAKRSKICRMNPKTLADAIGRATHELANSDVIDDNIDFY